MTRDEAVRMLRTLAGGLEPDDRAVRLLMERIAENDEAETLRHALAELGARSVIDSAAAAVAR